MKSVPDNKRSRIRYKASLKVHKTFRWGLQILRCHLFSHSIGMNSLSLFMAVKQAFWVQSWALKGSLLTPARPIIEGNVSGFEIDQNLLPWRDDYPVWATKSWMEEEGWVHGVLFYTLDQEKSRELTDKRCSKIKILLHSLNFSLGWICIAKIHAQNLYNFSKPIKFNVFLLSEKQIHEPTF